MRKEFTLEELHSPEARIAIVESMSTYDEETEEAKQIYLAKLKHLKDNNK
jgi:hypothetical protein